MKGRRSTFTISGTGFLVEREFYGVCFYRRVNVQKWSKALSEVRTEYGIRVLNYRFSVSSDHKVWLDNKAPTIEAELAPS